MSDAELVVRTRLLYSFDFAPQGVGAWREKNVGSGYLGFRAMVRFKTNKASVRIHLVNAQDIVYNRCDLNDFLPESPPTSIVPPAVAWEVCEFWPSLVEG